MVLLFVVVWFTWLLVILFDCGCLPVLFGVIVISCELRCGFTSIVCVMFEFDFYIVALCGGL